MREAYLEKLESELKEWESKAETLKDQRLDSWRSKRDAVLQRLEELRSTSSDRWDIVKMGVESAWEELKAAFETATAAESTKATDSEGPSDEKKDRRVA